MSDRPGRMLQAGEVVLAILICLMGGLLLFQQFGIMAAQKTLLQSAPAPGTAGGPEAAALREAAEMLREAALHLSGSGSAAVTGADPVLSAALLLSRETSTDIRTHAAGILGQLGRKAALERLDEMVATDPSENVRRETLQALHRAGAAEKVRGHVIRFLETGTPERRETAIRLAQEMADPRLVPPLVRALRESGGPTHAHLRQRIVNILQRLGDPRIIEPLLEIYRQETEPWARKQTLLAVIHLARPRHVPLLLELVPPGRVIADGELQRGLMTTAARLLDLRLTPLVLVGLGSEHQNIRQMAVQTLLRLRDPLAAPALVDIYQTGDAPIHTMLQEAFRAGYPGIDYDETLDTPAVLGTGAMEAALAGRQKRIAAQVEAAERPLVPGDEPRPEPERIF